MTRIHPASELIGLPVITLDTATAVGEIRDVLFDPQGSRVIGFTVRGRGLLSSPLVGLLPGDWVRAIGRDALLIESETSVVSEREGMPEALGEQKDVIGREVVTDAGASLGKVRDVIVEVEGPAARVVGYAIDRTDGNQLIVPAFGGVPVTGQALVLPADAQQSSVGSLGAFQEDLERDRRRAAAGSGR